MMKERLALIILSIAMALSLVACSGTATVAPSIEKIRPAISRTDSDFHKIILLHDDPDFPPGPGRDTFLARCTVCHSLRYVTMQPNFSKKEWGKIVAKMINTFSAHITGAEAREITEYLSTIKGPELNTTATKEKE